MLNIIAWLIVTLAGLGFAIRGVQREDNWSIIGGFALGCLGLAGLLHTLMAHH